MKKTYDAQSIINLFWPKKRLSKFSNKFFGGAVGFTILQNVAEVLSTVALSFVSSGATVYILATSAQGGGEISILENGEEISS